MKTSDIENEIKFAEQNPFRVIRFEKGGNGWLLLKGDKFVSPESWKSKDLLISNVSWKNEEEKEICFLSRLEDMKDTYKETTETDGNKVIWTPLIYG